MNQLTLIGKLLILVGVLTVAIGLILIFANKIPFLGRLPGDIVIRRENLTFYFPIVTSILLSIIITLIINLFLRH